MTTPDHAAIKARLTAATPGPWEYVDDYIGVRQAPTEGHRVADHKYEVAGIVPGEVVHPEDAVLIANAPSDIAALLAENERLTSLVGSHADGHRCPGEGLIACDDHPRWHVWTSWPLDSRTPWQITCPRGGIHAESSSYVAALAIAHSRACREDPYCNREVCSDGN